jgi:nucleoside-diphosphate-sugar epimerase
VSAPLAGQDYLCRNLFGADGEGPRTMSQMKVLVTGGTGFIGSALVSRLAGEPQLSVVASVRAANALPIPGIETVTVGEVTANTGWATALDGVEMVVHTAAVAHVRNLRSGHQLAHLQATNVDGALNLGRQALAAGVRRFVFISSIGVNGSHTVGQPFSELSLPQPEAPYAKSKLDAEVCLQALFLGTETELVVIRPPLVYASHAPGNFKRLLQLVNLGLPLPFASVFNQRSIISLENLVDLIHCCLTHPAAANELFLAAEGPAVSTADIVRYLAKGLGKKSRLFAFPQPIIASTCRTVGLKGIYTQLFESLVIDDSKARFLLGWQPQISTEAGLVHAGRAYLQRYVRGKS